MPIIRRSDCISLPMVFCPVKGNPYQVLRYGGWSCVVYLLCVYMCLVSSLWGSELVIGTVWGEKHTVSSSEECSPSPSKKNNAMKNGKTCYILHMGIISP